MRARTTIRLDFCSGMPMSSPSLLLAVAMAALPLACSSGASPASVAETNTGSDAGAQGAAPTDDAGAAPPPDISDSGDARTAAKDSGAQALDAAAPDASHGGAGLHYAICAAADSASELTRLATAMGGRSLDASQSYNDRSSWSSWADVGGYPLSGTTLPVPLSVSLILDSGTDLATAASGGYDTYYQQLAMSLGANKSKLAAIRVGWEMNGNWFAWSVSTDNVTIDPTRAKNYVAAFRRLAGFIRVYAPWLLIDWCFNQIGPDPTSAYPGDDMVDIIGMDIYEQNVSNFAGAIGNGTNFLLPFLDSFSQKTYGSNAPAGTTGGAKLMSLPEWQATDGDSSFITQMAAWLDARAERVSYMCYWDTNAAINSGGALFDEPGNQAAFVSAYAATTFGGTMPLSK